MYKVLEKRFLNPTVARMVVKAPRIANKAGAGQFIIIRVNETGERIPLTISDFSAAEGTITLVFQTIGKTTMLLSSLSPGESIQDIVGPLGRKSDIAGIGRACVVGGGVGCAITYPLARALSQNGAQIDVISGFRDSGLVILSDEFGALADNYYLLTDDGSAGERGFVTQRLSALLEAGTQYDAVFTVGPLPMMKAVAAVTKPFGIHTVCSMNSIMIDGTGMCGCCRVTVGGEMKFACIDGPEFDAHAVDFDGAIQRGQIYKKREEHDCNLFRGVV